MPIDTAPGDDEMALLTRRLRRSERARHEAESLLERKSRELDRSNRDLRERETALIARLDADNAALLRAQRTARIVSFHRDRGVPFRMSPNVAELLGLDPALPATLAAVERTLHPLDLARVARMATAFYTTAPAGNEHRYEFRVVRFDGAIRWLRVIACRQVDGDGRLVSVAGTVQDITEQRAVERRARALQMIGERNLKSLKRAEQRLAEQVATLESLSSALKASNEVNEKAHQAKSRFLAQISHEIRTPLNGVVGMIDALAASRLDAAQAAQVDVARRSAALLRQLVDDIIEITGSGLAAPRAPAAATAAGLVTIGGRRPRVLVVDDVETNRIVLSSLLDSIGCDHDVACDGAQAVAMVAAGGFDLVLMDVQMPVMDGVEATIRIRALPPPIAQIPVIGITAQALSAERDALVARGMTACLAKPIGRDALAEAMTAALAARDAEPMIDPDVFASVMAFLPPERRSELANRIESDLRALAAAFADAVAAGDATAIQRARHSLTGIASSVGAVELSALLASTASAPATLTTAAAGIAATVDTTAAEMRRLLARLARQ